MTLNIAVDVKQRKEKETYMRKGNKPQHKDPAKVVKGLGGINPADDPSDRNASTRSSAVRSNENDQKKPSGARGTKSNHNEASLRHENLPKPGDPNKMVRGLGGVTSQE